MRASLLAFAALALALAGGTASATPGEAPPTPSPPPAGLEGELDALLKDGQLGAAVVRCEQAKAEVTGSLPLRERCAKAYRGLGDRLLEAGSQANARARWEQAAELDPRLLDDPTFVERLSGTKVEASKPAAPKPTPRPIVTRPDKQPTPRPTSPSAGDGPRWGRGFGMGLSFGFDGVAAATLSWLSDERILLEVSFGIAYPATDVRVRWLGLKRCVTPFIGVGLFTPFGESDRLGLELAGYESLYELGEAFHLDLGLAWTPVHSLDLFAGVALLTPFDQDHPDTVFFFPQLTAGASWFF